MNLRNAFAVAATVLIALCGILPRWATAMEVLPAYNPYQTGPFLESESSGLASDLVYYLNEKQNGEYKFRSVNLPRKRLNKTIEHDPHFKELVLFLSPKLVNDVKRTKYRWSPMVLNDFNTMGSATDRLKQYEGPQ